MTTAVKLTSRSTCPQCGHADDEIMRTGCACCCSALKE